MSSPICTDTTQLKKLNKIYRLNISNKVGDGIICQNNVIGNSDAFYNSIRVRSLKINNYAQKAKEDNNDSYSVSLC